MDQPRHRSPTPAAERMRRLRVRQREGAVVVSLDVSVALSEALVEADWLDAMDAENPDAIAEALARLHDWWLARYGADMGVTL